MYDVESVFMNQSLKKIIYTIGLEITNLCRIVFSKPPTLYQYIENCSDYENQGQPMYLPCLKEQNNWSRSIQTWFESIYVSENSFVPKCRTSTVSTSTYPFGCFSSSLRTVLSQYSKTRCNFRFLRNTSIRLTRFGCFRFFSMRISRSAIFLISGSSSDSWNFLMATSWPIINRAQWQISKSNLGFK